VQTDLAKKRKEKKILEKGLNDLVTIFVEVRSTSYVSYRITRRIMSTSCLLQFSRERLAILHAALLEHAERLQDLLRPSWPKAGEI
jgi:hypothetical protein